MEKDNGGSINFPYSINRDFSQQFEASANGFGLEGPEDDGGGSGGRVGAE
jgi:hypothetical protein